MHLCLDVTIATLAYLGVLPTTLRGLPHADVLGHMVLIGLLAFFLDGALDFRPLFKGWSAPRLAPVAVLAVAGVEEIAQSLSPRRTASLIDYAGDVVGVCFFSWLSKRVADATQNR